MKKLLLKLGKKLTVSNWMILLFVATILPLNLYLIAVTDHYMTSLEQEVISGARSVMEIHLRDLSNSMSVMENYLFSLDNHDADFILASGSGTERGKVSYYSLYRKFQDHLVSNQISGLYFIKRKGERALSASSFGAGMGSYWEDAMKYVDGDDPAAVYGRWHMVEGGSTEYLVSGQYQGFLRYGAMIPTEVFLTNVENDLNLSFRELRLEPEPRYAGKDEIVISVPFDHAGLYLNLATDLESVTGHLPLLRRIEYFIAFALLAVIPLLLFLLDRILMRPMKDMEHFLSHTREFGDVAGRRLTREYYTKELNSVRDAINDFMEQIQHMRIESYEKELEKQRIREENILLQVQPHFLLNLFHLIYSMAEIKNFDGIQKSALYMSRYFREIFLHSETHSLAKEMELVRGYISVLELQYPDRFSVDIKMDWVVENVPVPILMIHGFLENIAKYAIRMDSYTEIGVSIRRSDGQVEILVSDDGPGIPEDVLSNINAGQAVEKQDGRHIGLSNLRERLMLQYGERASMKVYSEEEMGASIEVRIPWREDQDEGAVGR